MPTLRFLTRRFRRRERVLPPEGPDTYEALWQRAPIGMASVGPSGAWLEANPEFQRMIGYTEEELRARTYLDVTHPDDILDSRRNAVLLARGKIVHYEFEKRYIRKDGGTIWVRLAAVAVRRNGRFSRALTLTIDISARKQAEDELRKSEEKYRALYSRTPVMMHSIDREGRLLSVSDSWLKTLGYTRPEVLGRKSIEFLTPESQRFAVEVVLPQYYKTGSCTDVPYRFVKRNGAVIDVLLSATAEFDEHGEVERSLAVLIDVTERRRAEEELGRLAAELEERVRERTAIIAAQQETSLDGILAVGPDMRVLSWNKRFTDMWGIPEDIMGAGLQARVLDYVVKLVVDQEAFRVRVQQLYELKDRKSFDELVMSDGRVFERYSSPIVGSHGRYYGRIWYFRDITSRKQAENALREKSEALSDSNRELEIYASAVSHDLAAPLRKISAFGALLAESAKAKLDEKERGMLSRLVRAAQDMATLISDILMLSRVARERLPVENVDLSKVMAGVLADLEVMISESKSMVAVGPLPVVRGHSALFHRLLLNLASNAVKFRKPDQPAKVEVGSRAVSDGIEVFVRDDGIGFEPSEAEKIFEPFVRLNPRETYEGSGIGLTICNRIAQRYGGKMRAESAPGRGSTFTLWLPKEVSPRGIEPLSPA